MVCSNVWGSTRLNFGTTTSQKFFSRFNDINKQSDINFADNNTQYFSATNVEDIIESLERASVSLFRWFESNLLKGNTYKCHFRVTVSQEKSLNINNFKIKSSDCEKHLGVKFDSRPMFDQHIADM